MPDASPCALGRDRSQAPRRQGSGCTPTRPPPRKRVRRAVPSAESGVSGITSSRPHSHEKLIPICSTAGARVEQIPEALNRTTKTNAGQRQNDPGHRLPGGRAEDCHAVVER